MFESFRDRDLKDTGSSDEPGAGAPLVPSKGDHSGEFDGRCKTKHTQREGLYVLRIRCRGVGQFWCHDQDPVEILVGTKTLENTWKWAAVDTLVKLTKRNVDAAQISGNIENKLENCSRRHFSCKCYIKRRHSTLVENS